MLRGPASATRKLSLGRIRRYFGDVIAELKKVTWPTREDTKRLTILVIIVAGFIGILLGVADYGLTELMKLIIK